MTHRRRSTAVALCACVALAWGSRPSSAPGQPPQGADPQSYYASVNLVLVDLRVMRLRKKIEPDPEHPRYIRTVRNEGYIFVPDGN